MGATLVYQGQRFELHESLGDAFQASTWMQQRIAQLEYLRAVYIDHNADTLPDARIPTIDTQGETMATTIDTNGMYRWFPDESHTGTPFNNYVRVPLANGNKLFIWASKDISFAIEGVIPN